VLERLQRVYRPTPEDERVAQINTRVRERYTYRVALLACAAPPEEWTLCPSCRGSGRSSALAKECDWCRGGGFAIRQRGEVAAAPGPDET
jgi:hypothetical protein